MSGRNTPLVCEDCQSKVKKLCKQVSSTKVKCTCGAPTHLERCGLRRNNVLRNPGSDVGVIPSEVSLLDSAKPSWCIALRVRPSRFALVQCCVVLPNLVQFLNHVLDVNELKPLRFIEKQKRETTFRNQPDKYFKIRSIIYIYICMYVSLSLST